MVGASGLLQDSDGSIRGVAAADIYLDAISEIEGRVQLEETGGMVLVDANTGMIIGHKDSTYLGTMLSDHEELMYSFIDKEIKAVKEGVVTFIGEDKEKSYLNFNKIPDSNWISISYVHIIKY